MFSLVVWNTYLKAQAVISQEVSQKNVSQRPLKTSRWLSLSFFCAIIGAFVLFSALLPLKGLELSSALLPQWGKWTYALTSFFFPDWQLQPGLIGPRLTGGALATQEWEAFLLFLAVCLLIFFLYSLAISRLPAVVSHRYIIYSALFIGLTGVISPMLTSQDILSYIMYARMEAIYHLNPLTTTPNALRHDMLYPFIYWKNQPSIYGPTWVIITGGIQWILVLVGVSSPHVMVVVLRVFALGAHVGSSLLIWSISGHLQPNADERQLQTRKRATLAFAWNPLLLVEASINAHNDTFVLFFILLAFWFLVRPSPSKLRSQIYATVMFALATAIKVNIALLIPGLILYLWTQRQWLRSIAITLTLYIVIVVALYAPFWQNGAALGVFSVNPGANLNVNTIAEFSTDVLNAIVYLFFHHTVLVIGQIIHTATIVIFLLVYGMFCLSALGEQQWETIKRLFSTFKINISFLTSAILALLRRANIVQRPLTTPLQLIRFMALIWFLYCILGSPWFWPWYTITFFGLFALLEATQEFSWQAHTFFGKLTVPRAIRLFTFGIFSLYLFGALPLSPAIPDFYPMRWALLRGLGAWIVPVYVFILYARSKRFHW